MVIDPRIAGWFAGKAAKILGVALGLAIWLGSYFGVYLMGKAEQRAEYYEEALVVEQKHSEQVTKEAALNAREAALAERAAAETFTTVDNAIGELRNAITNKGPNPVCDLSDSELRYFRELAEATAE